VAAGLTERSFDGSGRFPPSSPATGKTFALQSEPLRLSQGGIKVPDRKVKTHGGDEITVHPFDLLYVSLPHHSALPAGCVINSEGHVLGRYKSVEDAIQARSIVSEKIRTGKPTDRPIPMPKP
jgi:hypothetical protein